jgi:RHS repeat-associated protein
MNARIIGWVLFVAVFTVTFSFSAIGDDYLVGGGAGADPDSLPKDESHHACENHTNCAEGGDPVFMRNCEYGLSVTDLSIRGRVLPVEIVRTYGSQREYNFRFGYGWDINYNLKVRRLDDSNTTIVLLDGKGCRREYTQDDGDPNKYLRSADLSDYFYYEGNDIFTLVKKSGIEHGFDINGNLTSITDKNGNNITFTYDSNGLLPLYGPSKFFHEEEFGGPSDGRDLIAMAYKLTKITDDLGRDINLYYDANGLLTDINDFAGRNWHYFYDPCTNDLTSVEDPYGNETTYGYSSSSTHNLLTITDPNGQTYINNYYDVNDKVYQQDYGYGTYTFDYNDDANTATITDREGYVTEMLYSDSGQVLSETIYTSNPADEPNSYTTQYSYNSNLEIIQTLFPAGNCIYYTYNENMDVNGIYRKIGPEEPNDGSDPNVIATNYTYDSTHIHDINSVMDPIGYVTEFEYDPNANVTKITYPEVAVYGQANQNPIVEFTYYDHGEVNTVTAPDGIVTKYEYYDDSDPNDPNCGKLWKVTVDYNDAEGLKIATEYKYDIYGNVSEVNDANGDITQFTYNELDLLTKTISPLSYITNYTYNNNKKLEQTEREITGEPNQITGYTYDILDHLKKVTDPFSYVTTYGYNRNEDPNILTDAEDHNMISVYDERDLLREVIDANGNTTRYTYTANGDINDVNDANSNVTKYEYDGFDRLKKITYPDDSNERFTYDKNSNLIKKHIRDGNSISYDYDALNRMTVKNREVDPNIYFSYDVAGRVREVNDLRSVSEGGGITTYSYDRIGRVNDVNDIESRTVGYEYDSRDLRTKLVYPDDTNVTYEYDSMSRLKKIRYEGSTIAQYSYDELSRRTQVTLGNDANAVYEYDIANRLTKLTNNVNDVNITFLYADYDKVGNRKSCKIDDTNSHVYNYDNLYQLIFVDYNDGNSTDYYYDALGNRTDVNDGSSTLYVNNNLNQYISVGGTSYFYDKNGNLADDNTYLYYYDCENRLTDVNDKSTGNPVASYEYDYQGRRVKKIVDGTPDVITKYCYDGDQVIAECNENDVILRKFIYGPRIDEPICMIDIAEGKTFYYHFDGLGSVIALSDVNSVIVERYSYDVFGGPNTTGTIGNPYLFTGRRYDNETDLYYYRARYYDYYIGRFLQPDPIGYTAGLNLYTYCGNNPIVLIDPFGLRRKSPEELYSMLGSYGNPYARLSIGRPFSLSDYDKTETYDPKVYGFVAGFLTTEFGLATATGTGFGFASSLKLDTFRRKGSGKISFHELSIVEPLNEGFFEADSGSKFGLQKIENAKTAKQILMANPHLMEKAIGESQPNVLDRILEFLLEMFAGNPER